MNPIPTPHQVEAEAKAAGLSVRELCNLSGIAHSTFTRWRSGSTSLSVGALERFKGVIDRAKGITSDQTS